MNRRLLGTFVTLCATIAIGACTQAAPPAPTSAPTPTRMLPGATETASPATDAARPSGPSAPIAIKVYFAYNEKMQPAARTTTAGTRALLKSALQSLLAGPTSSERAGGLSTMVPKGTKLLGVSISANVATVDFNAAFASGGGSLSMFDRLAQVVYTATQFPGVDAVTFKLDGKTVTVFGGDGIVLNAPRNRKACESESPAILVDQPAWRGTLKAGAAISGTANVFEAAFTIEVRDSTGSIVSKESVQASSGTGTRGVWSIIPDLSDAAAGVGSIRVYADSQKDGTPIDVVKLPVILEP